MAKAYTIKLINRATRILYLNIAVDYPLQRLGLFQHLVQLNNVISVNLSLRHI